MPQLDEFTGETVDFLELRDLEQGARVRVTAGEMATQDQITYDLLVMTPGECPEALMLQTNGIDGSALGPHLVRVEGAGRWTTPEQNPVQSQPGLAFSIGHGLLRTGSRLVVNPLPVRGRLYERLELRPDIRQIKFAGRA